MRFVSCELQAFSWDTLVAIEGLAWLLHVSMQ
jgi:hypothetical protein